MKIFFIVRGIDAVELIETLEATKVVDSQFWNFKLVNEEQLLVVAFEVTPVIGFRLDKERESVNEQVETDK